MLACIDMVKQVCYLQQLALSQTRVTHKQHMDVSTDGDTAGHTLVLAHAPHQRQQQSGLLDEYAWGACVCVCVCVRVCV